MNAKDSPCQDQPGGAEQAACFQSAFQKSDAAMNLLYQRVRGVVDGTEFLKLKKAQQLWIQYREASCSAESELYAGGSAYSMVKLACLEALTRHRTEELKAMYGWRLEKWDK